MRRFLLSLVVFLVVASAATGVHASTECERWFVAYKNALAHSKPVHQLRAANHRLHRYVHRKLAKLTKPKPNNKPKVLRARTHRRPKTREEMLRDFQLACGDELPDGSSPALMLMGDHLPPPPPVALDFGDGDGSLIAENELPILPLMGGYPPDEGRPGYGGFGGFGGGGGNPGGPTPHIPDTPPRGGTPDNPPVPVSSVPEPGSVVLVLTGIAGAAGAMRRRMAR
ncbi:MAG TPA: PEP-CTERM sorting domain-containing protein [Edaphobacter sp.]